MITIGSSAVISGPWGDRPDPQDEPKATSKWNHKGIMEWLATKNASLTGTQFQVLFTIAKHADKHTSECWPSMERIGKLCGMSKGNVSKIVEELVALGCIRTKGGGQGRGNVTHYWLIGDRQQNEKRPERSNPPGMKISYVQAGAKAAAAANEARRKKSSRD
jgi:DNA-binding MarR family transcriptional regulator